MAKVTRRGFLGTTAAPAAVGAMMATPGLSDVAEAASQPKLELTKQELAGPLVAHVRNVTTGEIALFVGTREIVFHNRRLVTRLLRASH